MRPPIRLSASGWDSKHFNSGHVYLSAIPIASPQYAGPDPIVELAVFHGVGSEAKMSLFFRPDSASAQMRMIANELEALVQKAPTKV